jgi:pimeloyl-ACP methyl ester carboxylesterase
MPTYQHATIRGLKMFYREAGSKSSPTIVLLHGFPSSSHMFRDRSRSSRTNSISSLRITSALATAMHQA